MSGAGFFFGTTSPANTGMLLAMVGPSMVCTMPLTLRSLLVEQTATCRSECVGRSEGAQGGAHAVAHKLRWGMCGENR